MKTFSYIVVVIYVINIDNDEFEWVDIKKHELKYNCIIQKFWILVLLL